MPDPGHAVGSAVAACNCVCGVLLPEHNRTSDTESVDQKRNP